MSVTISIRALTVVADAEGSGTLAASETRVRELVVGGGVAKVLVDSGIGRVSDGRWGVGAREGALDVEDEAAGFLAAPGEFEILRVLEGASGNLNAFRQTSRLEQHEHVSVRYLRI